MKQKKIEPKVEEKEQPKVIVDEIRVH